jgi:hypothetical protein
VGDCHRHKLHPIEVQGEVAPGLESTARIAGKDFLKCDALFRVRAIVDEKSEFAVLLKDIALPMDDEDDREILAKGEP